MRGNISQHCVAGQNAIRDEDAEHNWVWHMLIALHLHKFGSTVWSWTRGLKSEWMLLENNKSLCCSATAGCQACVKSPPKELAAWLLPRKPMNHIFISAPASLSGLGNCICLKFKGNTHYELQLFFVVIKPAEIWWMRDGFYRINCRGIYRVNPNFEWWQCRKAFQLSGAANRKRAQIISKGRWAFTQNQKELGKHNKEPICNVYKQ